MKTIKISFLNALVLLCTACGRAEFSGNSDKTPDVSVPVFATATDYYIEIGQNFSDQLTGEVELTNIQLFGLANWPGVSSLPLEIRASLTGTAANGATVISTTAPSGWSTATPVINTTLPSSSTQYQLASANIKDTAAAILRQQRYWIVMKVRYGGIDLGKTLLLTGLYVHVDGQRSLGTLAPVINLGF